MDAYDLTTEDMFEMFSKENESFEEFEERFSDASCSCGYYCDKCTGASY